MTITPNDPRLTSYALGELDPEERAEIEAELKQSEELRSELQAIRNLAASLTVALQTEPVLGLTRGQIRRVEEASEEKVSESEPIAGKRISSYLVAAMTAAASVFLAFLLVPSMQQEPIDSFPFSGQLPFATERSGESTAATEKASEETVSVEIAKLTNPDSKRPIADGSSDQRARLGNTTGNPPLARPQSPLTSAPKNDSVQQLAPQQSAGAASLEAELRRVAGLRRQPARPTALTITLLGKDEATNRDLQPPLVSRPFNTESYDRLVDNPFRLVSQDPLSTFSIDVDTASYANLRRFLNQNSLPPRDAVRIEEMVNYFSYDYPEPTDSRPFGVDLELSAAPWKPDHHLLRIALKGREIGSNRPAANLVFLLDVSGSMQPPEKLPLLKQGMKLLANNLGESDRVAIVVYAGSSGLALPSTSGENRQRILDALSDLRAGGSTNGAAGIQLAYQIAEENFIEGGINRVILATDGDFNVGMTNQGDLTRLIEAKASSGVFLSVLGLGMGNYKDSNLEKLASKGNGNYAYIDTLDEARKVLVEEMSGTLVTIAKDVKIQVEFNPARVTAYRLIGYENRLLLHQDFNDDAKDAGEIGAGHVVTALYEIVPSGLEREVPRVDPLRYQSPTRSRDVSDPIGDELLTVKLRYKQPHSDSSQLIEIPMSGSAKRLEAASGDLKFASAVAAFGMLLRDSEHKGESSYDLVIGLAEQGRGHDSHGYRAEFIRLAQRAKAITFLERN